MRRQLIREDCFGSLTYIAGVDVGYDPVRNRAHASVVTMHVDELTPLEQVQAYAQANFPYIPGLLSFREIPSILAALGQLKAWPDMLMVDGQGIAHPRRMGIAAHLGVIMNIPSIGVAKSRLIGKYTMPGPAKGDFTPLMAGTEQLGVVLRSRDKVHPLFISPGHRVGVASALEITRNCLTRYRLPEPTRLADKLSKCNSSTQKADLFHP